MNITETNITEMKPEDIAAAEGAIPKESPVVMLNLIRYNAQAEYGKDQSQAEPCSGRDAYLLRYAPAFNQVAAIEGISGIHVLFVGSVLTSLVGAGEQWDDIVLVEYPSFAAFRRVVESASYREIAEHHRKAALQDWRLFATAKLTPPH